MCSSDLLLKPGGVFFNVDIPYQPDRIGLPEQVLNHWQVVNNGEPFWVAFAETAIRPSLIAAGFDPLHAFAEYQAVGGGREYFVFGGRK